MKTTATRVSRLGRKQTVDQVAKVFFRIMRAESTIAMRKLLAFRRNRSFLLLIHVTPRYFTRMT
jgi:hypothetical protein